MELLNRLTTVLSVERIKHEILRTAYGDDTNIMKQMDARVLIGWYLVFCLVPWFIYDIKVLVGLFFMMGILAYISRISPLIVGLMGMSLIMEIISLTLVSLVFGGNLDVFLALFVVTLKLLIISLASVIVFTSMDPERFSDALLSFGLPVKFSFGISYAYRMLPILIEEYHSIFNSFRLRGKAPNKKGILYSKFIYYYVVLVVKAFYPMLLNTAKRVRTTVEALETKGFSYSMSNPKARKLKLSYMQVTKYDYYFIGITTICTMTIMIIGKLI